MQSMNCLARSLACVRARACSRSILKSPLDAICVLSVNVFPRSPIASFEPSIALRVLQVHVHVDFIVAKLPCSHMPSEQIIWSALLMRVQEHLRRYF
jgi:hypothetical protein